MLIEMILIGLAGWRLASLVSSERGPFDMFPRFRELFGFTHDDGKPVTMPDTNMARLLSCVWCTSVWTVGISWLVWQIAPFVVLLGAAAAVAVIVEQQIRPAAREIRILTDDNDGDVN